MIFVNLYFALRVAFLIRVEVPFLPRFCVLFSDSCSLDFFLASDPAPNRKKEYGRKAVRAQRAKEEQEERNRDATRGKSTVERLLMENQSHQKLMAKQAGYEATLMSLNLRADQLQKRAILALEAAKEIGFPVLLKACAGGVVEG